LERREYIDYLCFVGGFKWILVIQKVLVVGNVLFWLLTWYWLLKVSHILYWVEKYKGLFIWSSGGWQHRCRIRSFPFST